MPGGYLIDLPRRLVLSRAWGYASDEELLRHAQALAADPDFHPSFAQVADLRAVEDFELRVSTLRELASLSPFGAGSRRALVVGSPAAYGMARMFQVFRQRSPDAVQVFRTLAAALEWLTLADHEAAILGLLDRVTAVKAPES